MNQFIKQQILFEDQDIIVCEKSAGFPVQSAKFGQKDMVDAIRSYLVIEQAKNQPLGKNVRGSIPYVGVIHRLDQPVEGIVVFAKTPQAAKSLSVQIAQGLMEKRYKAVVMLPDSGLDSKNCLKKEVFLEDYLLKDGRSNTSRIVDKATKDAKLAKLSYRLLAVKENLGLVDITLKTGRHHQIRVQMANHQLPLWGDTKYNQSKVEQGTWTQIALCAYRLSFSHPKTKKNLEFIIEPKGEIFHGFSCI